MIVVSYSFYASCQPVIVGNKEILGLSQRAAHIEIIMKLDACVSPDIKHQASIHLSVVCTAEKVSCGQPNGSFGRSVSHSFVYTCPVIRMKISYSISSPPVL